MKKLASLVAPLVIAGAFVGAACSSSTSGSGTDGGGTSSGGGTVNPVGVCVLFVDDAGNPANAGTPTGCLITSVNGTNSGPPCSSGLTYATSCPAAGLVGCCTTRGGSDQNTVVLIDQCTYADLGESAAQLQQACVTPVVDGGAVGTWSTTP